MDKRKLADTYFLQYVSDYDIVYWVRRGNRKQKLLTLIFLGSVVNLFPEINPEIRGRYSGGLAVYYKTYLKNYVSVVKKEQTGIFWIKISEELFPFDQNV